MACHVALPEQDRLLTQRGDHSHVVTDEQHGSPLRRYLLPFSQDISLELGVAHREDLVYEKDLRLQMRGHGKARRTYIPDE